MKLLHILLFALCVLISFPAPGNEDLYNKGRKAAQENNHIDCIKYLYAYRTINIVKLEKEHSKFLKSLDDQIQKSETTLRAHFLSTISGSARNHTGIKKITASGKQQNPFYSIGKISPAITPIQKTSKIIIVDKENNAEPLLIHVPEYDAIYANKNDVHGLEVSDDDWTVNISTSNSYEILQSILSDLPEQSPIK